MIKFAIFIAVLVAAFKFTPLGDYVWANTIAVVNPAAEESKVLGQLESQVKTISNTVNQSSFAKLNDTEKVKTLNNLLSNVTASINEAQDISEKKDLLGTISTAVKNVLPGTDKVCE